MQMKKSRKYILLLLLLLPTLPTQAGEDWEVNPNLYQYSMTITGVCQSSDTLHEHTAEIVIGAFNSEGICVGKSTSRYYSSMAKYRIPLLIYGNTDGEKITLQAFFPEFDQVIHITDSIKFGVNDSQGNFKDPVIWTLEHAPDSLYEYEDPLIYPNPAHDDLTIVLPGDVVSAAYVLFDLSGNNLQRGMLDSKLNTLNISNLPSGSFIIKLNMDNETRMLKFMRY